jgi:hypothetical protein
MSTEIPEVDWDDVDGADVSGIIQRGWDHKVSLTVIGYEVTIIGPGIYVSEIASSYQDAVDMALESAKWWFEEKVESISKEGD